MESPKLSVLMANYNHAEYLKEALDAILAQSYTPLEIIITDDASTDNSFEILQVYARKYSLIRLLRNKDNLGAINTNRQQRELARGDYFYSASADDKVLPGFFEKSMKLLSQYPQAGLCSTRTLCIDAQGRNKGVLHMPVVLDKKNFIPPDKALVMLYKYGSWMQGNTVILKKRALIESGGYIPELYSFCDGFIYQVIAAKYGVCFISEALAVWRQLKDSYSATIAKDPEVSLRWIAHAKKLMRTTYQDLFSSDFVDSWEKRELINFYLSRFYNLQNDAFKDLIRLNLTQNLTDRCLFGLRRLLGKIDYFILKFYLYRRAKLFASQLIIQKLKSFWVSIIN